jgi:hypothetical protein
MIKYVLLYHWCSSSLGHDRKSSNRGIGLHVLQGSSLCLIFVQRPTHFCLYPLGCYPLCPATLPYKRPTLQRHLLPSCIGRPLHQQAVHQGTSMLDRTCWHTYRPWRPQHCPCTVNPNSACKDIPGTAVYAWYISLLSAHKRCLSAEQNPLMESTCARICAQIMMCTLSSLLQVV